MRILTVSNNVNLLSDLNERLSELWPGADMIKEVDPLMAGKYAFHNAVDAVFAEVNMKRMTGLQLIRFIRREHTGTLTYLVGRAEEIRDSLTMTAPEEVTGVITYPFTEDSFAKDLQLCV